MRIESFQFHDRATGWQLGETKFDALNLLVGVSGVGKTKILDALRSAQRVALGAHPRIEAAWSIRFEEEGQAYRWTAETDNAERFVSEQIVKNDSVVVRRTSTVFTFQGRDVPRLNNASGAITLFDGEPSIAPLRRAFEKLYSSLGDPGLYVAMSDVLAPLMLEQWTLEKLKESISLSTTMRAYLLQERVPDAWQTITNLFMEVFPTVTGVRVDRVQAGDDGLALVPLIHEKGSPVWIRDISSGMRRTLGHIIEMYLAPPGTVILIDDFENSLGNNCLPALVDLILSRAPDLQFIITSHHPYVINNLPVSTWKLVQRSGSRVCVLSARDIPSLQKVSRHAAFDRLLNLPEYEDGIT